MKRKIGLDEAMQLLGEGKTYFIKFDEGSHKLQEEINHLVLWQEKWKNMQDSPREELLN